jgi:hypothetical protein
VARSPQELAGGVRHAVSTDNFNWGLDALKSDRRIRGTDRTEARDACE